MIVIFGNYLPHVESVGVVFQSFMTDSNHGQLLINESMTTVVREIFQCHSLVILVNSRVLPIAMQYLQNEVQ